MKCKNSNCSYAVDGNCLDGLPPEECPSLSEGLDLELISPESEDNNDSELKEIISSESKVQLFGQSPLKEDVASVAMKAFSSKVISFVGPVGVGKTTLISSMYDVFSRPNHLNVSFGRSLSMYAFEKLCHHARVTSNGVEVSTPRTTSADGVAFYNISIVDSSENRQEIFLADRSGESYTEMLNDIEVAKNFYELKRSDLICILIDASSLGSKERRHRSKRQATNLIKLIVKHLDVNDDSRFILLLTKYDLVEGSDSEELCNKEIELVCQAIQQDLAIKLGFIRLSARPFLKEQEKPDSISQLWDLIAKSERTQSREKLITFKSERSFHNLELIYD